MIVAPERVLGPAWHWKTDRRRVTSEMDGRGYCQDRLESSGTGDERPTRRLSPVPHLPRRSGAQAAIPPSRHGHDLEHWPLRDTLILGALADAVPSARAHLRQLLLGWGQAEVGPDAAVVVSELVTNSVVASAALGLAAAPVLIWLGSDSRCLLLLAVTDASPRPPVRPNLGPDAERGRGLALVEALSNRWGWQPASIPGLRKVVWAELVTQASRGEGPPTLPGGPFRTGQPHSQRISRLIYPPFDAYGTGYADALLHNQRLVHAGNATTVTVTAVGRRGLPYIDVHDDGMLTSRTRARPGLPGRPPLPPGQQDRPAVGFTREPGRSSWTEAAA